ncbi:hypothetical protein DINM_001432 [Dirofilaria immitis]|nr:hypothetical protein [Dirofilaria immitis]
MQKVAVNSRIQPRNRPRLPQQLDNTTTKISRPLTKQRQSLIQPKPIQKCATPCIGVNYSMQDCSDTVRGRFNCSYVELSENHFANFAILLNIAAPCIGVNYSMQDCSDAVRRRFNCSYVELSENHFANFAILLKYCSNVILTLLIFKYGPIGTRSERLKKKLQEIAPEIQILNLCLKHRAVPNQNVRIYSEI